MWDLPPGEQRALRRAEDVEYRAPMLATLSRESVDGAGWIVEHKFDGVRMIATRERGERPRLWSRNRKPMDASYPEIVEALDAQGPDRFVVDGEVVAGDGTFSSLQARMHLTDPDRARRTGVDVHCHLFDLLVVGDVDVTRLPLRTRRDLLATLIDPVEPLRASPWTEGDAAEQFARACAEGAEGVIVKRADAPYKGGRGRDWLKRKCVRDQEFVVGGWTDPAGTRQVLGALLVGYHDASGALRYAGKVGTGFDAAALNLLRTRLDPLATSSSPFVDAVREPGQHWVRPELVCAVGFGEWTVDGRLRHPRYEGLRVDKEPGDVVREG